MRKRTDALSQNGTDELGRKVKEANRRLYDAIADRYEDIDGRRSSALEEWLRRNLSDIGSRAAGGRLLDIGTGNGFVTRCAKGLVKMRVGTDISPRILAVSKSSFDLGVAADLEHLPFADSTFDMVTCFAVLHHLHAFDGLASEVARVLKPHGIFYSDHDMDAAFYRRYRVPLRLYRKISNAKAKYIRANEKITGDMYDLAECRESGVEAPHIVGLLEKAGLTVEVKYHWFGLTKVTDTLFGKRQSRRGRAPLLAIFGKKKEIGDNA